MQKIIKMKGMIIIKMKGMIRMIGIIRKFDELGRVTIPMEYRRYLGLEKNARVEVKVNDNYEIVLKPVKERGC